jgi:flavin-dependent dehydrogenase
MYDAIIIGARCAGAPTAMLLARKGHRVLLVDKATFPSDTMSTLLIYPAGMQRLARWGLAERVRAGGCPSIRSWRMTFDDVVLDGFPWSPDGVTETLAPRRTVLDHLLVDAAVAAGVELREAFAFEDVLRDGDTVVGVRGRSRRGASCEERARVVIGADGMRSPFAGAVGAPKVVEKPGTTCAYYAFHSGVDQRLLGLHVRGRCSIVACPTNDELALVAVIWPHERFHEVRADIEGNYLKSLDDVVPELGARVRAGRREERFVGTADLPNFLRRSQGPGWALVGDAGYHKDPIAAQGISDAFRYAELLAEAVDDGLAGRRPLADALVDYEKRRNESAMPRFEWACRTAEMRPVSQKMLALLGALKSSQEDTNLFMGLTGGTVLSTDFFQPDNLARIVKAGAAA